MSEPGLLAVAEVAARLGVSVSTLRSWERRYGLGATTRTAGGHRRYTAGDMHALLQMRRLVEAGMSTAAAMDSAFGSALEELKPDAESSAERESPAGARSEYVAAIGRLDAVGAEQSARAVVHEFGAATAWIDVFAPHLQSLGEVWRSTGGRIEQEHLAAAVLQAALTRHSLERRPASVSVLAVATARERHTLPLHALEAALAEHGTGVCVLGTLPAAAVCSAVGLLRPRVVLLWARSAAAADIGQLRDVLDCAPIVCAAGPGWYVRRLPPSIGHVNDLPGAMETLQAWSRPA